jgi:hypothetical protein
MNPVTMHGHRHYVTPDFISYITASSHKASTITLHNRLRPYVSGQISSRLLFKMEDFNAR